MRKTPPFDGVSGDELHAIERLAIELAGIAGAEITTALGSMLAVRYKKTSKARDKNAEGWRDPVSEIDHKVETLIRARLAENFPEHDIIGEEMDDRPGRDHDFVWAVDPIDGTTNFVNGFPLFAASIGILHKGRPIVGALWCSLSHALRSGVYHAAVGGKLRFDGIEVTAKINPAVRRRLIGVPAATESDGFWDTRKTGSAALECAMVAAGLMQAARFATPNIWDVAGGLALVSAAGGVTRRREGMRWVPMTCFEAGQSPQNVPDLRYWRGEIIIGEPASVDKMCEFHTG